MSDRLPWFRCFPSALLGAIAGMDSDEGYTYIALLLRIYETGGPVAETARTLSRRTGLLERKVSAALDSLITSGKLLRLADGRLDSSSTHDELAWQQNRKADQSSAGKASAAKRANSTTKPREIARDEKAQQNQQNSSTPVERPRNHLEEDTEQEERVSTSLRSVERALKRKARKPETEIDPNWQPDEQDVAYALKKGMTMGQLPDERDRYVNHHLRKGSLFRDWRAAWRTWVDSPYRKSAQAQPPRSERREPVSKNPFVNDLLNHMDPRHDTPDDDLSAAPNARSHEPRLVEYGCQVQEPSRSAPRALPQILDLSVNGSFGGRSAGS